MKTVRTGGVEIVGFAKTADGRDVEVLRVGRRLRILEGDRSPEKTYADWDDLRRDWPSAVQYGTG